MYTVNMTATVEDQAIHVEQSNAAGEPSSLAYGIEGDDPLSVVQIAWKLFLRTHPAQAFHLQLPLVLPPRTRSAISRAWSWLLRQRLEQIVEGRRRRRKTKAVRA